MVVEGTPIEHHPDLGLWVKREDLSCPGGPHFSKTRGVFPHVRARNEGIIGVLDTYHSQGGWAVAKACAQLGKRCTVFYPVYKHRPKFPFQPQQQAAKDLGADLFPLQAGRSAVLYHQAKRMLAAAHGGYMMPNALKLPESVEETANEVLRMDLPPVSRVIVSASSATIAAGVLMGLHQKGRLDMQLVVHMGYSRSEAAVRAYLEKMSGVVGGNIVVFDEGYSYADKARPGPTPPFPCNEYYDLKAFRWWMRGREPGQEALLWNIG